MRTSWYNMIDFLCLFWIISLHQYDQIVLHFHIFLFEVLGQLFQNRLVDLDDALRALLVRNHKDRLLFLTVVQAIAIINAIVSNGIVALREGEWIVLCLLGILVHATTVIFLLLEHLSFAEMVVHVDIDLLATIVICDSVVLRLLSRQLWVDLPSLLHHGLQVAHHFVILLELSLHFLGFLDGYAEEAPVSVVLHDFEDVDLLPAFVLGWLSLITIEALLILASLQHHGSLARNLLPPSVEDVELI